MTVVLLGVYASLDSAEKRAIEIVFRGLKGP